MVNNKYLNTFGKLLTKIPALTIGLKDCDTSCQQFLFWYSGFLVNS